MRSHLYQAVTDTEGNILFGTQVTLREVGTNAVLAETLYTSLSGTATYANPFLCTSGVIDVWFDQPKRMQVIVGDPSNPTSSAILDAQPPADETVLSDQPLRFVGTKQPGYVATAIDATTATWATPPTFTGAVPPHQHDGSGADSTALGQGATASGTGSTAVGDGSAATSDYASALGQAARATSTGAIAFGVNAKAQARQSIAIGYGSTTGAAANVAIAIGYSSQAVGVSAVAIGDTAFSSGTKSLAVGAEATASADNAVAVGVKANATAKGAFALGNNAKASYSGSVALGENAVTTDIDQVALGSTDHTVVAQKGISITGATKLGNKLGFFGSAPISKPTITGSTSNNVAVQQAIAALASMGLWVDNKDGVTQTVALRRFAISSSATTPEGTPGYVLNIGSEQGQNHFSALTAPQDGTYAEHNQTEIQTGYTEDPLFTVLRGEDLIDRAQLRAWVNSPLAPGSAYPTCALDELDTTGDAILFDPWIGIHWMRAKATITHLPAQKPEVIVAEAFNGARERVAIVTRLNGSATPGTIDLVVEVNGTQVQTLDADYVLGTEFEWILQIENGNVSVFYNDTQIPVVTSTNLVPTSLGASWSFRTGALLQSNTRSRNRYSGLVETGNDYANVLLRDLVHWHTGWPTPTTELDSGQATYNDPNNTTPALSDIAPGTVLDIGTTQDNHFDLYLSHDSQVDTITQTMIAAGYSESPLFQVWSRQGIPAVRLQAVVANEVDPNMGGAVASLREVNADGTPAANDILTGTHFLRARTRINRLDAPDRIITFAALWDGTRNVVRLATTPLPDGTLQVAAIVNGTTTLLTRPLAALKIGEEFSWMIQVVDGTAYLYYNDLTTPGLIIPSLPAPGTADSWMFRLGVCGNTTGSSGINEVEVREVVLSHQALDSVTAPGESLNIGAANGQNHFRAVVSRTGDSEVVNVSQNYLTGTDSNYPDTEYTDDNLATVQTPTRLATVLTVPLNGPKDQSSDPGASTYLRELDQNGNDLSFNPNDGGVHYLRGTSRIITLPPDGQLILAELFNGATDRVTLRTETYQNSTSALVFRINGSSNNLPRAMSPIRLNEEFEWMIKVDNKTLSLYFNDLKSPFVTQANVLDTSSAKNWHFRVGAFAQSTGSGAGVVELRRLSHWHTGWGTPQGSE